MIPLLIFSVFQLVSAVPSCLHLRSHCLRNPQCAAYFVSFENTCGYSLTRCSARSPSDCVRDLRAIRELLPSNSCACYKAIGFHEECDFFRQLIWNHPCERLLLDAGAERSIDDPWIAAIQTGSRRSTRTPAADQVQQLVAQFSGELETKSMLERATCNEALDNVCMKHVSCRQLWNLFRSGCSVDKDNKCTMSDPAVCWQSFEGLSWTGLGHCRCESSNSDCHWIRLHTNYNKCIYEISLTRTGSGQKDEGDRTAELYRRRFETNMVDEQRKREELVRQREEERRRKEEQQRQLVSARNPPNSPETTEDQNRGRDQYHIAQNQYNQVNHRIPHVPDDQRSGNRQSESVSRVQEVPQPPNNQINMYRQHLNHQSGDRVRDGDYNRAGNRPGAEQGYQAGGDPQGQQNGSGGTWNRPGSVDNRVYGRERDQNRQDHRQQQQGGFYRPQEPWRPREEVTTTTTTTTTTATTTTPRPTFPPTAPPRISVVRKPETSGSGLRATINERVTSPPWWDKQKEENTFYRPLFEAPPTPPPGYYRYTTVSTVPQRGGNGRDSERERNEVGSVSQRQREREKEKERERKEEFRRIHQGRPSEAPTTTKRPSIRPVPPTRAPTSTALVTTSPRPTPALFATRSPFNRSTCQEAVSRCEASDECRWNLGELRARCSRTSCRRDDCAQSLSRFASYVPKDLSEAVMFCQCSPGDQDCLRNQELFYPSCLYSSAVALPTCTQTASKCSGDTSCRMIRDRLRGACPLSGGECVARSLAACRRVLLSARGSILEQPCFCPLSDVSCITQQRLMIPHNPCIEQAMRDLAEPTKNGPSPTSSQKGYPQIPVETVPAALAAVAVGSERDLMNQRRKEEHRKHYRTSTTTTSTTTTTTAPEAVEVKPTKSRHRTTMKPPPPTDAPAPWETTTTAAPTTTTTFVTQPPPPAEGCQARDASGRSVFFPVGTVMRRYVDWSGRCSSWCECAEEDQLSCERLPCLEDGSCEAPLTSIEFGERIFLKGRGACFCESSKFICEIPQEMPELYPGLYVAAGYSQADVDMLRKDVPSGVLERAGFSSADPGKDIGSRLQVAFERMQPEWLQCRLVLLSELSEPGHAFFRVEWWGQNERFNQTKVQWQYGGAEKVCSPSVSRLSDLFANSDSLRYQLVLSTVKQLKVLDYLDGIPSVSMMCSSSFVALVALWLLFF